MLTEQEIPKPLPNISYPSAMSEKELPAVHTRLIGGFLVLDKHVDIDSRRAGISVGESSSYIDLGFGFNKPGSTFCGVDRVAVTRDPDMNAGDKSSYRKIKISYSAMACNPSVNAITLSRFTLSVHSFYAGLLFREGIARVLANS